MGDSYYDPIEEHGEWVNGKRVHFFKKSEANDGASVDGASVDASSEGSLKGKATAEATD
mgnify:CR=1 FL=1